MATQPNRQHELNDTNQRGLVIPPYAKGFSERVTKVLQIFNIKVACKPIRSISTVIKKPNDTMDREREASRGIVYKLKFKDCDCVYVGQTSRAPKTRVIEQLFLLFLLPKCTIVFIQFHVLRSSSNELHMIDRVSV